MKSLTPPVHTLELVGKVLCVEDKYVGNVYKLNEEQGDEP